MSFVIVIWAAGGMAQACIRIHEWLPDVLEKSDKGGILNTAIFHLSSR
jgi:hypothetical protein